MVEDVRRHVVYRHFKPISGQWLHLVDTTVNIVNQSNFICIAHIHKPQFIS